VVAPGMLQNPAVRRWLGGVEPAWTLLDQPSFDALRRPLPPDGGGPIRLAADLAPGEVERSPVASNALLLLRAAAVGSGLTLTATGNLSRSVVAEMVDRFRWPGFDKAEAFRFHKVVNEPDFLPLSFIRRLAEAAGLLRKSKGHLRATPRGRALTAETDRRALPAILFHLALWHLDLSDLGRGLHGRWPQPDVGIVIWSLSVAAGDWQSRERLTRLCTIPINGVLDTAWDTASFAMEARILRPLLWFGLLEHREGAIEGRRFERLHLYRKAELFDRFVSFDVQLEAISAPRH
jgi:hypothetical protein